MTPPRRVITGLDANGKSCILIDGPADAVIWSTQGYPAENAGTADQGSRKFSFPLANTVFMFSDFPPGMFAPMHATDSVDYIVVVAGEVKFITETGEVLLRTGDTIVDRGIMHAWRNDSGAPCRIMNVMLPAKPVGKGATLAGTFGS